MLTTARFKIVILSLTLLLFQPITAKTVELSQVRAKKKNLERRIALKKSQKIKRQSEANKHSRSRKNRELEKAKNRDRFLRPKEISTTLLQKKLEQKKIRYQKKRYQIQLQYASQKRKSDFQTERLQDELKTKGYGLK